MLNKSEKTKIKSVIFKLRVCLHDTTLRNEDTKKIEEAVDILKELIGDE
ncbi:MAG: hypothetical protein ACRCXT_18305 [Paraclostridium sp.]